MTDPRHYQVAVLSGLLFYGLVYLDFEIQPFVVAVIIGSSQFSQYVFIRLLNAGAFDPRSALTTSLSLCLLLRTQELWLAALTAFIAIASKFLIRVNKKHLFNPSNIALVSVSLLSDKAWISSGLWGQDLLLAFVLACLGLLVLQRSKRTDITLAFLLFFSMLLFTRAWWLGDPVAIPCFQLQNGALLIFAFFMISDPMSTPNSRTGRFIFAAFVVMVAGYMKFVLYLPNAVLYALAGCNVLVPIFDKIFPDKKYQWPG